MLSIHVTYVGVPRHSDRHQIEFWMTVLVRTCQRLTQTNLRPIRISLAHPREALFSELESFFGCTLSYAADGDELIFRRGAAELPLPGADPHLNRLLTGYCEEILARRATPVSPIRAKVENAIAPHLPHGKAQIQVVASLLGMSRRTLSRRLAAEGLNFTGILEEMRRDLALRHLKDPRLSISQIAWLLGFQEASAFTMAFKRWTGATPKETRVRLLSPADAV